jgi:uncharacterized protein YbbC (DUF1343 family)
MIITGLEIAVTSQQDQFHGRRIGLITHPAAVTHDLTSALDALLASGAAITALFGPEHGFEGSAADAASIAHGVHPRLGVPVYSLYGETLAPTPAMLEHIDLLVFDMQDVGVRFYTYLSTLYHVMCSAAANGVPLLVLDRPNPLGGAAVEGPILAPGYESFIGVAPLPIRHGMTLGELARFLNTELKLGADVRVTSMTGWRRAMDFSATGLPWVPTSPAIPRAETTVVYPGTCFVEGTNLSEGRGTPLPFELVGAPWLDGYRLAQTLNALDLPGVRFRAAQFTPTDSKHAGVVCSGVQAHVQDRRVYQPLLTGLHIIAACRGQNSQRFEFLSSSWEGAHPHFDLLAGNNLVRRGLEEGAPVAEIVAGWTADEVGFRRRRAPYLLYNAD